MFKVYIAFSTENYCSPIRNPAARPTVHLPSSPYAPGWRGGPSCLYPCFVLEGTCLVPTWLAVPEKATSQTPYRAPVRLHNALPWWPCRETHTQVSTGAPGTQAARDAGWRRAPCSLEGSLQDCPTCLPRQHSRRQRTGSDASPGPMGPRNWGPPPCTATR